MRKFFSLISLLSLMPIVSNGVVACASASGNKYFDLGSALKELSTRKFNLNIKKEIKSSDFIKQLTETLTFNFSKILFQNKNHLIITEEFLNAEKLQFAKKIIENIFETPLIYDVETNKTISSVDLNQKVKHQKPFALKIFFNLLGEVISFDFDINIIEKLEPEKIKELIENHDYDNNGFFDWFFLIIYFKKLFDTFTLDQFKKNFIQSFEGIVYLDVLFFLEIDRVSEEFVIKNNGHELLQEDLESPGQLNLTIECQYLVGDKKIAIATKKPIKITIF